jgi:thioesterase domain-containing protein/acyl carrier protein
VFRPDGVLCFAGRKDPPAKLRGTPLEVAEVEQAILEWPQVRAAAVAVRPDVSGNESLVGYLVPRDDLPAPLSVPDLSVFLRGRLPPRAVPSAFVFLGALPLSASDRIDRKQLLALPLNRASLSTLYTPPRTDLEGRLARIWEEVLQVQPVGVHDPFFEAGGDSMAALDIFVRIRKEFGQELPLSLLFERGTVAHLAQALARKAEPKRRPSLVAIQPHGGAPPFYCVHGIGGEVLGFEKLAALLGPGQPFFGLQARGLRGGEEPLRRVEDMAACYLEEVLDHQPRGPYYLGGYSLGGAVAYEMACRLRRQGHEVGLVALLDKRSGVSRKGFWDHQALTGFLRNLPNWVRDEPFRDGLRQVAARVRERLPLARARAAALLRRFLNRGRPDVQEIFDLDRVPDHYRRLLQTHYEASQAYVPPPYPGRVTVFRARTQPLFRWEPPALGWEGLAAGVEVRGVAGAHDTILVEPYVRDLARQLGAALEQSRRT